MEPLVAIMIAGFTMVIIALVSGYLEKKYPGKSAAPSSKRKRRA